MVMITDIVQRRSLDTTVVTVTSSLTGVVFYHWYMDGAYLGATSDPSRSITLQRSEQVRLEILDTNDRDFDPVANAPAGHPARREIVWVRSIDPEVIRYRVDQQLDGGDWETIAYVHHEEARWTYSLLSPRLDDLSDYAWRVVPLDAAGNEGTAVAIDAEFIVRIPDAPNFTVTFVEGVNEVLFTGIEAALPLMINDDGLNAFNDDGDTVEVL